MGSPETAAKQGQGNGTVPAGLAITIRKLTNLKAPFAPFCVEIPAFVAPERPLLTQIVHPPKTGQSHLVESVPKLTHKKSLQIPYTYGKLAFGFYAMAAVATVESNKRKGRKAASPPFIDCQSPLTHFLIADLPIRNRRNFCALNKNLVSNRQKNGIFLRFPCAPRLGGLHSDPVSHLPLVTNHCLPNPCPPTSWRGNSQELKTRVTP